MEGSVGDRDADYRAEYEVQGQDYDDPAGLRTEAHALLVGTAALLARFRQKSANVPGYFIGMKEGLVAA